MRNDIRTRLTLMFVGLAVVPLLIVGSVLAKQSFDAQAQQALILQGEVARRVAAEVTAFIQSIVSDLELVAEVEGLQKLDAARQTQILGDLQTHRGIYDSVALLDPQGREKIRLSRLEVVSEADLRDRSREEIFTAPQQTRQVYYGPIQFDQAGEPLITIALPLLNLRDGSLDGVLVIDARIKKIWELIRDIRLNVGESVYIIDAEGRVIAHRNPSVVLRRTIFDVPDQAGVQVGLDSAQAVVAVDHFTLGQQEFTVVAERQLVEALRQGIDLVTIVAVVMVATLALAIVLGVWAVRQVVQPIQTLVEASEAIEIGDFSQRARVFRSDEIGRLAETFNRMADQLGEFITGLEQQVAARTQRLKVAASFSQSLGVILDVQQLLAELVNRVQEIGYYHAHIYLLDQAGLHLVIAEGTGEVGAKLKAQGHSILLSMSSSVVARAARTGRIIVVDDVRKSPDWLPNPLLPETQAEIAVPIISQGKMVGVLDVQADRVAGLDDSDADLLQFLAHQVAIALQNAELFSQTQAALEEVQAIHRRYLAEGWQTFLQTTPTSYAEAQQQALPAVDEAAWHAVKARVLQDGDIVQETLEPAGSNGAVTSQAAIVAPLKLRGETIGTLGLQRNADGLDWSEEEVALVQAVTEQVAVALENARLFAESQRRAAREETIAYLTQAIWVGDSIESVLEQAVVYLGQTLQASNVILRLLPKHSQSKPSRGQPLATLELNS